MMENLQSDN